MSKDGKDAAEDSDELRRRRRRKSGLRVPSDNVPRKGAGEVSTEPASDPRLAVSVAYAFGSGESAEGAPNVDPVPADLGPASKRRPVGEGGGDSVDIAFDDFEEDAQEVGAAAAPAEALRKPPALARPASAGDGEASGKPNRKKMWPRVQTETLSETDLEDMLTEAPQPLAVDDSDEDDELPTMVEGEPLPSDFGGTDDNRPTIEMSAQPEPAEGKDDGVVVGRPLAKAGAPVRPSDAGDSGEIIADDMIEEVSESGRMTTARRDTQEINPAEIEELAAAEDSQPLDTTAPMPTTATKKPAPVSAPKPSAEPVNKPPPAPKGGVARAAAVAAATGQARSKRRRMKPWYEEIFDEDYLRTLPFLTPQSTQFEANFVIDSMGVEPGNQILDVGCGYGRHAMELAARGYHVVGLDSSLPLLLRGADEAQRRGLKINFVHGDMREITFESQFDGAYCLFSTFGYFDDEANKRTAQSIGRALKPGARFVIEVLNRDYIISDLPSRVWWEGDGCVVLEEVEFNYFSSRILSNRSVVFDDGRQLEQEISIRAYSLHELGKLLHAAGFRVIEVSGSMYARGRYFGGRSRDIVVVAEKRPPKVEAGASTPLPRASTEPGLG